MRRFRWGCCRRLAKRKLLSKFTYLSTVSGGGYIGSWLSAWMAHGNLKIEEVEGKLGKSGKPSEPELPEIGYLRDYSNYLSPRLGFFSADTWTLAAIYLRNLLINWLGWGPLVVAAVLLPRVFRVALTLGMTIGDFVDQAVVYWGVFGLGVATSLLALVYVTRHRDSGERAARGAKAAQNRDDQGHFLKRSLLPLAMSGVCFTLFWQWTVVGGGTWVGRWMEQNRVSSAAGFLIYGLGVQVVANLPAWRTGRWMAVMVGGIVGGLTAWGWVMLILHWNGRESEVLACAGPPMFWSVFLLAGVVDVGLAGASDDENEWMARAAAWLMIVTAAWGVGMTVIVYGPWVLTWGWKSIYSAGVVAVGTALYAGYTKFSSATKEKEGQTLTSMVMGIVAQVARRSRSHFWRRAYLRGRTVWWGWPHVHRGFHGLWRNCR